VAGTTEPVAAAVLPDGNVIVADRAGFVSSATGKPLAFTGARGPLKQVRSIAANSRGDLFVIDRGTDGAQRCKAGGTSCAAWGPPGRYRTVKVGAADLVHLLDDSGQSIRVVDDGGRLVATMGPGTGENRLNNVIDIALDEVFGIYALDTGSRNVHIGALQTGSSGLGIREVSTVPLPTQGDSAVRDPSAIGVAPDGSMLITTRGSPRIVRFQ
jgi:hypothetical protein